MSSVILFDIDGTLFNTKKWIDSYIKHKMNTSFGISESVFEKIREQYRETLPKSTAFKPDEFLALLQQQAQADPEALRTAFYNPEYFVGAIYDDVIPALDQLQAQEYSLGIFSEGDAHFQLTKLKSGELAAYFDPDLLFISDNKTAPDFIESLPMDSVVIDDRLENVEVLSHHSRCSPVWLHRHSPEKDTSLKTIQSLSEIRDIV